ncbi:hypothetical protein RIF29_06557 [Crotalaria pallida]|uniref:Peptidase A1 domain-containing protein n=1 Tax=Crotalaria pallida TaxID=3830 RepID=A0AAN9PBL6_CROPI
MLLPPAASSLLELKLERAFPSHGSMQQLHLHRLHDFDRHRRKFSPPGVNHVINFSLQGSFNPFESGIYYTTLILGSPPREFRVQIDTGSDITWISCVSCSGCPVTSVLPVQLSYFDPGTSSTSSLISCSDRRCGSLIQSRDATCNVVNNRCSYRVQYEDGDTTTGPHYNVHLQSISVNGQMLRINPGVFSSAMIDSGTSLAYLPEEAYNSFADAIAVGIPKSAHVVPYEGDNCYLTNISVADIFPPASLNFADGASLALRPQDYLIRGDLVKDFTTTTTINNNMPPPLKINKDSHLIKKSSSLSSSPPSSSSTSSSSTSSSLMVNTGMAPRVVTSNKPPQRHPVIIYTHSPKVIHTHPRDFMALVQKLTGQSRSEDDGGGSNNNNPPPPRQPKQEPVSHRENVMVGNEDNEASSVITEDNNCSSSIGENQVNSCFAAAPLIMEPPMNPYMANLPVFPPPSSSEFMYPSQPLLNYSNSLFFSHNMRASLEGVNEFHEF